MMLYQKNISKFCKIIQKNNIPLNLYKTGVEMRREKYDNGNNINKFVYSDYGPCDKIIIQDNHHSYGQNNEIYKKKVIKSCHRYSEQWLKFSEKAYDIKFEDYKDYKYQNRKLRIVIFTKNSVKNEWQLIYKLIKNLSNVDVKLIDKPRGILKPLHIQDNSNINITSSELINWCDIVISHSSSVLIEAVIKNKKIFFLEYLSLENQDLVVNDYDFFEKMSSHNHLISSIKNFQKTLNHNFKNKDHFLTTVLGKNYKDNEYLEKIVDKLYN